MPAVDSQVDRILAVVWQFELLKLQNEARGDAVFAGRKDDLRICLERGHYTLSIRVHERNPNALLTFFKALESNLYRQRAERMRDRNCVGADSIE